MFRKAKTTALITAVLLGAGYAYAQPPEPSVELFFFEDAPAATVPSQNTTTSLPRKKERSGFLTAPSFFDGTNPGDKITIMDSSASMIVPPKRPKKLKASKAYLEKIAEESKEPDFSDLSSEEILSHIEPSSGEAKASEPEEIQVKAKPMRSKKSETISVVYQGTEYAIDAQARAGVTGQILKRAYESPSDKIRLYAYASEHDKTEVEAKRLSLQRALDIRDFLVSHDVDSKRIAIFPMGYAQNDANLPNRFDKVDVVFTDT